jgi:hypothetical protein
LHGTLKREHPTSNLSNGGSPSPNGVKTRKEIDIL